MSIYKSNILSENSIEKENQIEKENKITYRKLQINYKRNRHQEHTQLLDNAAANFKYKECKNEYWNPEEFSLLYATPLWEQATTSQKIILNQLYWIAYYSQIISAEIATIFFNQTSAAGLYAQEGFRSICDMLDLESSQERAHINAFQTISEQVEEVLFGKPVFGYPMRTPYAETMIFANTNTIKTWWKKLQLQSFGMLSAGNTFLACQYFTVRGLRTLNGKLIQHKLSKSQTNSTITYDLCLYSFKVWNHPHSTYICSSQTQRNFGVVYYENFTFTY